MAPTNSIAACWDVRSDRLLGTRLAENAVNDRDCTAFLQWALPRVGLRWAGFRKVRRLVCKRLARRLRGLGLADLVQYRALFERDPAERQAFDALCRIPISRFYRDRGVFDALREQVLPELAERVSGRGDRLLRAWSAGSASGEEPYTLRIVWELALRTRFPGIELRVLATDVEPTMLERARNGCYGPGSLGDVPKDWLPLAFERKGGLACVREPFRRNIEFKLQDIRMEMPDGLFDLILCRNLVFTYFEPAAQEALATRIVERLRPGGVLAIGIHEKPPAALADLHPLPAAPALYAKSERIAR